MKKNPLLLLITVMLTLFPVHAQNALRVGVFKGNGAAETCVLESYAAAGMDRNADVQIVESADIATGVLDHIDVLVIPGGGGSREYLNLGAVNRNKIRHFVQSGGGIVGICAGAYLLSNTPGYSCMEMSNGQAIDIEHDNRGRGVVKVTLDPKSTLFAQVADRDTLYIMYYEGPVIVPAPAIGAKYVTHGTMESDVHVEGNAPANMTNDKPFFYSTAYGRGRVFSVIGHPEATPGMQWMLPAMVRYVAPQRDNVTFKPCDIPKRFIAPDRFEKEILMDHERREKEEATFKTFLYGNEAAKLEGIHWIEAHNSWDGKRWLQGLIYDESPLVRAAAINAIKNAMHRYYIRDIEALLLTEKDDNVRQVAQNALEFLKI